MTVQTYATRFLLPGTVFIPYLVFVCHNRYGVGA